MVSADSARRTYLPIESSNQHGLHMRNTELNTYIKLTQECGKTTTIDR